MLGLFHTAKRIIDGDAFDYDITASQGGSLEDALQEAGFKHERRISTKRGSWNIFLRHSYSFNPFLPGQSGSLADSAAAVYSADARLGWHYAFTARPGAPVNLEVLAGNAQSISSATIESWPMRFLGWLSKGSYSNAEFKHLAFPAACITAGGVGGGALAAAGIVNPLIGVLTGAYVVGPVAGIAALAIPMVLNYCRVASALGSNAGNYAFGKEATAALNSDLAMLQKHKIAAQT